MTLSLCPPLHSPVLLLSLCQLFSRTAWDVHISVLYFQRFITKASLETLCANSKLLRLSLGNMSTWTFFLASFQANKQILTSINQAEQRHPSYIKISGLIFRKVQELLLYTYLLITFCNLNSKPRNPHQNNIETNYKLWQWCSTNLILAHTGEMKLQIANVYFSMLTMATEITVSLGLQYSLFYSSLYLFSCEQIKKINKCADITQLKE